MEEIISFFFIWMFVEIMFWGIIYGTGSLITSVLSFGKWKPDGLIRNDGIRAKIKKQSGFTLIKRSGQIYLGVASVVFLGFSFWVVVVLMFFLV